MKRKIANTVGCVIGFLVVTFYWLSFPFMHTYGLLYANSYCKKKYEKGMSIWNSLAKEERREICNTVVKRFYGEKVSEFIRKRA